MFETPPHDVAYAARDEAQQAPETPSVGVSPLAFNPPLSRQRRAGGPGTALADQLGRATSKDTGSPPAKRSMPRDERLLETWRVYDLMGDVMACDGVWMNSFALTGSAIPAR